MTRKQIAERVAVRLHATTPPRRLRLGDTIRYRHPNGREEILILDTIAKLDEWWIKYRNGAQIFVRQP